MPIAPIGNAMKTYKRTVLITGATDGIGRQLALKLSTRADENFVIVHGRCKRKCQATLDYLAQELIRLRHSGLVPGGNGRLMAAAAHCSPLRERRRDESASCSDDASSSEGGALSGGSVAVDAAAAALFVPTNIDYVAADFSHASEITRMAEEIRLRFPALNTFIACASILVPRKMRSHDSNELTLQVNHLSHFMLWNALLPLLEQNAPARLITVGSMLHAFNTIDWNDVNCEQGVYDKFIQYSRTKLMNHLSTFYIHRLLFKRDKQFQVTANVVDADRQADHRVNRTYTNRLNAWSASESHLNAHANGIQTLVRIVESQEFVGVSGKCFDANGKQIRQGAEAGDVRLQDRIWETSRGLCARMNVGFTPLSPPCATVASTPIRLARHTPIDSSPVPDTLLYAKNNGNIV